jgi:hypothetical protein
MCAPINTGTPATGAAGVIYVSSPVLFDTDPAKVIAPTVNGTINALEAAARAGVKRYVLAGSSLISLYVAELDGRLVSSLVKGKGKGLSLPRRTTSPTTSVPGCTITNPS